MAVAYRDALRHRDFRRLLGSVLVDATGTWAYTIALQVYVYDRTHSTLYLAVLPASRWVASALVGPFAGVLADRVERVRLIVGSSVVGGILVAGMTVVVTTDAPVVLLPVLSALVSIVTAPTQPAVGALVPDVVDEPVLGTANGLVALVENVTIVLGPAIGGLLLLTGRPALAVGADALSFFAAAGLAGRIGARSRGGGGEGGGALRELADGVRAITPTSAVLMGVFALDAAVYGASSALYVPLSDRLGTGSGGVSYLLAASAAGSVLAAGVAARLSRRSRLAPVIVAALVVQALPYALTAVTTSPALATVLQLVSGAGMIVVDVIAMTALQRDVASAYLSRVLALLGTAALAGTVLASFLGSGLLAALGLRTALLVIGFGFSAAGLLTLPVLVRGDRRARAEVAASAPVIAVLDGLRLFDGATQAGLARLVADATRRNLPVGDVLIREGDDADRLYVLLRGSLAVTTAAQGRRPAVEAPGYVGEIGLLRGIPRTATVTVATPAEVLEIGADAFATAVETTPPSRAMLETAGLRLG